MSFAPVLPHDPIEQIAEDIYMARGSVKINPIIRFTRNMVIARQGNVLTLINPIRLNKAELKRLDELGTVKHILRLGYFHGLDDPFYMDRYSPEFWCQEGGQAYLKPSIDHALTEDTVLPFGDASLFCFKGATQPESILLLGSDKRLLLTCDSIQNYGDYSNNNLPARLLMPFIGFPKTTLIGPIWLKDITTEGTSLRSEFDRLLELDFDSLLSAHGTLLKSGAHKAVQQAIEKAFSQ